MSSHEYHILSSLHAIIGRLHSCTVSYCCHSRGQMSSPASLAALAASCRNTLLWASSGYKAHVQYECKFNPNDQGKTQGNPSKCTMQSPILCFSKKHTFNLYFFMEMQSQSALQMFLAILLLSSLAMNTLSHCFKCH